MFLNVQNKVNKRREELIHTIRYYTEVTDRSF